MKMKLFGKAGSRKKILKLEEEVNAWVEQNPKIKIVDIKQSSNGGSFADTSVQSSLVFRVRSCIFARNIVSFAREDDEKIQNNIDKSRN